jgi:hypothetical protein
MRHFLPTPFRETWEMEPCGAVVAEPLHQCIVSLRGYRQHPLAILSASIVVSQFARREISTEQEASVQTPPPSAQRPRGER